MKSYILAMNEGFVGKVEIPEKDLDGECLQLIFSRKQKKNEISREVTVLLWWARKKILSIRRPNLLGKKLLL